MFVAKLCFCLFTIDSRETQPNISKCSLLQTHHVGGLVESRWLVTHRTGAVSVAISQLTGPCLNIKTVFLGMRISIIKIRWWWDCLIFIMGILIPRKTIFILRQPPDSYSFRNYRLCHDDRMPWKFILYYWPITGNGLVPNRWQAITWSNSDSVLSHTCVSLGLNQLM